MFLKVNRSLLVVLACLFCSLQQSWAAPALDQYQDIEGVRVYSDNEKTNLFYLSSTPPVLDISNGPGYGLDVFRYVGTKATGDQGAFRVRGVLSLSFDRKREPAITGKIKRELRAQKITNPRLKSVPVSQTAVRIVYVGQEKRVDLSSRGIIKELRLPLDSVLSEVLWDAVEAGQTQVSVVLEEAVSGVRKEGDDWSESTVSQVHTLPITMDMVAFPKAFMRTDLGGQQQRGYTGVDVFCYDFLENLDENLYAKQVEIAIPTPGKPLIEVVEFKGESDYRARVDFSLSRELDEPYRYRIIYIYKDGTKITGSWLEKRGDRLLDVTEYSDEERSQDEDLESDEIKEE